ncbi:uncharacterized protein LOC144151594 [Haemaphysalis longicornis]
MNFLFTACFLPPLLFITTTTMWVHADSGTKETHFPDAFKVFQVFGDAAAIFDSNDDNILECVLSNRTAIDLDARTAVFTWTLRSPDGKPGEKVSFFAHAEAEPGALTIYTNDDPTPTEGAYTYSDYQDCVILKIHFQGDQCILWVQRELKDSVPQHCIDHFVADCGAVVPLYSRDLCYDGEGDYK